MPGAERVAVGAMAAVEEVTEAVSTLKELNLALDIAETRAAASDYDVYTSTESAGPNFINGDILDAALQPDGKLIIVGDFTKVHGRNRNRIARLTNEGKLDPTIN